MTTWSPDSCSCVIECEWPDEQPEGVLLKVIHKCLAHQHLPDNAILPQVYVNENKRKSDILGWAQELLPGLVAKDYIYEFDANRNLIITIYGFPQQAQQGLQARCNATFGAGKVTVQIGG